VTTNAIQIWTKPIDCDFSGEFKRVSALIFVASKTNKFHYWKLALEAGWQL
jgi:hypothetical protein